MTPPFETANQQTLLVFNCHEAWVYQLACLGFRLDIITGLKGMYKSSWDTNIRPIPPNSRFLTLPQALKSAENYYCIITNNIADLLDVKSRPEPKIMMIHLSLEARMVEEKSSVSPEAMKKMLHKYVNLVGCHVVAVTQFKGESWGFTEDIVTCGINPEEYPPFEGNLPMGLRVSNFILRRQKFLLWDFHKKAFDSLPVRIVGHNPEMPDVWPSQNWDHLKQLYQSHRFFIHTADPQLEDGFNMASVEAMAAGMPILGNCHPTSPIRNGVNGFLSDNPDELRNYAQMLLQDRDLAIQMGHNARQTAIELFSIEMFRQRFLNSIQTAREKIRGSRTEFLQ
jgi:glycosyltransferase involved in cell wall biosynthesis